MKKLTKAALAFALMLCVLAGMFTSSTPVFADEDYDIGPPIYTWLPYYDYYSDRPYYKEVEDMYYRGLMTGMDATTFAPKVAANRAYMATVIYRYEGSPVFRLFQTLADVPTNAWFAAPAYWTHLEGIISGYNNGNFGPTDVLTREQLCTILWRYANRLGYNDMDARADLTIYPDSSRVSSFATDGVSWCVAKGIFAERNGKIDPWSAATREELAAMFSRLLALTEACGACYNFRDIFISPFPPSQYLDPSVYYPVRYFYNWPNNLWNKDK